MTDKDLTVKDAENIFLVDPKKAGDIQKLAGMGMKRVDPADVRPPFILLTQKSSTLDEMHTVNSQTPKVGQYYHTGKRKVYNEFECYFLWAAKSQVMDRRKNIMVDQYNTIGVMADDLSLFAMRFKSSALFALASLFTAAQSQQYPMFGFRVKMETKMLEGEKGQWYVPVVRVQEQVTDKKLFNELYSQAAKFDQQTDKVAASVEEEDDAGDRQE